MGRRSSIAFSITLAFWVVIYGYTLNIIKYTLGMAVCGAFVSLIIGYSILVKSNRTERILFSITYVAYIVLTLFSLSENIRPAVQWASEFLVFSVISVIFIAFYDALVGVGDLELIPQLIALYALVIALMGTSGWVLIALLGFAVAFTYSMRALIGYLMSLVFTLLPFVGIPAVVYNAANLPHIVLPNFNVGSITYVTALIVMYIALTIAGGVGGILSVAFWKSVSKPERVSHTLMNSAFLVLPSIVFDALVITITYLVTPWIDRVLAMKIIILTFITTFTTASLVNTMLFQKKAKDLMNTFNRRSEVALRKLDGVRNALNSLSSIGIVKEKVNELRTQINDITASIQRLREYTSNNQSPNVLRSSLNELRIIEKDIADLEKETLNTFTSLVTTIQSLKPIVDPYVRIPSELWDKAVTATKAKDVDDVFMKSSALRKIAEKLCTYLEKAIEQSITELKKIVEIKNLPKMSLRCSSWSDPVSALREMIREYTSILAANKHAIQEAYNGLLRLREKFYELENEVRKNDLQNTRFGTDILKVSSILSSVPDVMPSLYSAIHIINNVIGNIQKIITSIPEDLSMDIDTLSKGLKTDATIEITTLLHTLSNTNEKLAYLRESLRNVIKDGSKQNYAQLVTTYNSALPKLLSRIIKELRELTSMRQRIKLIPLIMEYMDYLLMKGKGTLSLDELPFKKEIAIHFIQLYAISRKNVDVKNGKIIIKKISEEEER